MRFQRCTVVAAAVLLGACLLVAPAVTNLVFEDAADRSDPSSSGGQSVRESGPPERTTVDRYYPATHAEVAAMRHRMLLEGSPAFWPASPAAPSIRWSLLGPRGIYVDVNGFYYSGRIRSIATDTTDSAIVYAGSARGGIWVTRNGGVNWRAVGTTIENPAIGAIAVNASDRSVWAGTGEFYQTGIGGTSFSVLGAYLYKSVDFGTHWTRVSGFPDLFGGVVTRIAFDAEHPSDIYVATSEGLYKSTNFGGWFNRIRVGVISDVLVWPHTGQSYVLAADMGIGGGAPLLGYTSAWMAGSDSLPRGSLGRWWGRSAACSWPSVLPSRKWHTSVFQHRPGPGTESGGRSHSAWVGGGVLFRQTAAEARDGMTRLWP